MHPYNKHQIEQRLARKKLLKAMIKRGWTVKRIAKAHGVSHQAIYKVLR